MLCNLVPRGVSLCLKALPNTLLSNKHSVLGVISLSMLMIDFLISALYYAYSMLKLMKSVYYKTLTTFSGN